jgi:hypothetical protein
VAGRLRGSLRAADRLGSLELRRDVVEARGAEPVARLVLELVREREVAPRVVVVIVVRDAAGGTSTSAVPPAKPYVPTSRAGSSVHSMPNNR